ncbi:MAG: phospholipase D-like domain-containing protein [Hyphomicrobium sp.]
MTFQTGSSSQSVRELSPDYWFLSSSLTGRRPVYTTGNSVEAFVDGRGYFRDLKSTLANCNKSLLIAGWRVSSGQFLDPEYENGGLRGQTFLDVIKAVRRKGSEIKALLYNAPGTDMPGPFRLWHAWDNREFCDEIIKIGGDAVLDSRLSDVPASSHHQKFIVASSSEPSSTAAYLGGIDVCYDRWDHPPHDNCAERQRDFVREGFIETHQPSQPGWHDIQVKLQGPAVAQIWEVFRNRWNDPRPPNSDPFLTDYRGTTRIESEAPQSQGNGAAAVQINLTLPEGVFPEPGGAGEQTIARGLAHAIDCAKHYVYVEDQYVWPCALVERLEAAIKRGVRVLLVVARDYDAPGLAIISRRLRGEVVDRLRAAGPGLFRIHHLERDNAEQIYVHSKLLIIDDRFVSVGSANFNARSLINDTEIQASIVDTDAFEVPIGGKMELVGRFAHDLRRELWAEHLQIGAEYLADPIAAFDNIWSKAPIAPSRRAVPHVVKHGLINLDAMAEHITTLVEKRMAHVAHISLPSGISDRSAIKLAVDTVLRGPLAAGVLKSMEEILNPDLTGTFASAKRGIKETVRESFFPSAKMAEGSGPTPSDDKRAEAEMVIRNLRKGRLPRMVDWIDPVLLGAVAVRTIISSTIGQYADQRPMQAAMDECTPDDLLKRHDYSKITTTRLKLPPDFASRRLTPDADGRVWLDFVADLGDGFEATYAMAYMVAAEKLDVETPNGDPLTLPAGEVLVFGGDLAYPNATVKEYTDRCLMPYDMAFQTDVPKRQLFYIAGNHDWYDGLTAFTSVFCTARDRYTHGLGKQIGGWRCHQRRSYFALKMPYNWWLWGVDLGLTDTIDDAQLDYFHTMAESTKPGDNVIIITHAPGWVNKEIDGLHEMTMLARSRGASVPLVLAGDLHHYSRYYSDDARVHMITSGGGGAFAHATHQLRRRMKVNWAVETDKPARVSDGSDRPAFNREEREAVGPSDDVDFTEKPVSAVSARSRLKGKLDGSLKQILKDTDFRAPNFYPERWRSRLLVLRNIWLPFHNWRFAILLGLIYMVFGWVFQLSVADPIEGVRQARYASADIDCLGKLKVDADPAALAACQTDAYKRVDEMLESFRLKLPTADIEKPNLPKMDGKEMTAEQIKQVGDYMKRELRTFWEALLLTVSPKRVLFGMLANPAFFIMVVALWAGLVHYVDALWSSRIVNGLAKLVLGSAHFLAHMALLLVLTTIFNLAIYSPLVDGKNALSTIVIGVATYTSLIVILGGILGGMVWGIYWAITSALFGMHMDAFSALGIANYKNFLRMSFAPDRLTIYPVGLAKVPGKRGWRAPLAGEVLPSHNPLILPKKPLKPQLIEGPIVIETRPQ